MKRFFLIAAGLVSSLTMFAQQSLIKAALPEYWANPTGAYKVAVTDQVASLPEHTLFYPEDLSAFPESDKLPVLVMSGPGVDKTSSAFRPFFTEVASHGYLFIVNGVLTEETVNTGILPKSNKQDTLDALEWVFAENYKPGSPFYGKIDLKNICLMGQSAGGIQALDLMNDPRVTLLCLFNSGLFASNPFGGTGRPMASMGDVMNMPKEKVFEKIRVPIAYFVGDTDMARQNATDDFKYIKNVPVFVGVREIPGDAHAGTFREMNGGAFAEAAVDWLDWHMKGDIDASMTFKGAPSKLEKSSTKWIQVFSRNIDHVDGNAVDWANFKRYENANTKVTTAPDMVLMGDSITDNWASIDPDFFEQNNFIGRGISGQTVSQMIVRFKQDVLNLNPKVVAIMAGTNDLCQQMAGMAYYPDATMFDNTVAMCELALAHGMKVLLCSVTPCSSYMPIPTLDAGTRIVELNKKLKAYADSQKNVTYVDYFTPLANEKNGLDKELSLDGVHPMAPGYVTMEQILIDAYKSVTKSKKNFYILSEDVAAEKAAAQVKEWEERMASFRRR